MPSSHDQIAVESVSLRLGHALLEVAAGVLPIFFLFYALLASGCSSPATQRAPSVKGALTQRLGNSPAPSGNGQGTFGAVVALEEQALPDLSAASASYSLTLDGVAHAVSAGQAVAVQTTDDVGAPWWVLVLASGFASPVESLMIAVPAASWSPGSVSLDGAQAVAWLVSASGEPLAFSTSGSLALTAAPSAVGALAAGSFTASFAPMSAAGCSTDADCARGEVCLAGACAIPDCTTTGCAAGMRCDAPSGQCLPSGCLSDADCGAGLACRSGACVPAGCAVTGCPSGSTCDAASGACVPTGSSCARTGCPSGSTCDAASGTCVPTGSCARTGCPAGMRCDASGACVASGSTVGSCFPQPRVGTGSFSGSAGGVAICSASALSGLQGGPDAGLFDSDDEGGGPATLFVIGDLQSAAGDAYLVVELDRCPAAGDVLTAPATRFYAIRQSYDADSVVQIQKLASAGTATFGASARGGLSVTVTAQFGADTVSGSGLLP